MLIRIDSFFMLWSSDERLCQFYSALEIPSTDTEEMPRAFTPLRTGTAESPQREKFESYDCSLIVH